MDVNYMIVDGVLADYVQEISVFIDQLNGVTEPEKSFEKFTSDLMEQDSSAEASKIFDAIAERSVVISGAQEKDFEPAYNLVLHILTFAPDFAKIVPVIINNLVSNPPEFAHGSWLVLSVLTNLFNIIPTDSPLRYTVFNAIIDFAGKTNNSHLLVSQIGRITQWVEQWKGITSEQKRELFSKAAEVLEQTDSKAAYEFSLKAVAISDKPDEATKKLVQTALESEYIYDFDPVLSSTAVQALGESSPLLVLLKHVSNGDLKGLQAANGSKLASEAGVDYEAIEEKAKVSALALVASQSTSRTISYSEIVSAIDVDIDDVERWVINAIRAGLVEGRLSQMEQKFDIHRASPIGKFGIEEWKLAQSRLDTWKSSLREILQVAQGARENIKRVQV